MTAPVYLLALLCLFAGLGWTWLLIGYYSGVIRKMEDRAFRAERLVTVLWRFCLRQQRRGLKRRAA